MKALLEEANPEVAAEAEAARQAAEAEAVRLAAEAERRRAAEQAAAEERAAAKARREAYLRQKAEEQRRAAERAEALRVAAERAAAAAAEKEALRTRPTELNAKVERMEQTPVQPWQAQFVLGREARMRAVEKENLARNQLLASIRSSVARIQDARNREHLAAQRVMWAQQNMSLDAMQRWSMDLARAAIHAETGASAMERKSKSSA